MAYYDDLTYKRAEIKKYLNDRVKELKEYSDAINYFSIFTTEHPKDYLAHYILAELYFLNSNYNSAQVHFQKALTLNPNDSITGKYAFNCTIGVPIRCSSDIICPLFLEITL